MTAHTCTQPHTTHARHTRGRKTHAYTQHVTTVGSHVTMKNAKKPKAHVPNSGNVSLRSINTLLRNGHSPSQPFNIPARMICTTQLRLTARNMTPRKSLNHGTKGLPCFAH